MLAPTRELAMQIDAQCQKFAVPCKISSTAIYGGVPKYDQKHILRNGVDILIATPGRLIDFMEMGVVRLNRVTFLVLDEADRMLVSYPNSNSLSNNPTSSFLPKMGREINQIILRRSCIFHISSYHLASLSIY